MCAGGLLVVALVFVWLFVPVSTINTRAVESSEGA
jgi:hypothetical protein